jgi:hypothetical protein
VTIPLWVILLFLFGLELIGAVVLLLFLKILRRQKRRNPTRRSYVIISHPHI